MDAPAGSEEARDVSVTEAAKKQNISFGLLWPCLPQVPAHDLFSPMVKPCWVDQKLLHPWGQSEPHGTMGKAW